MYKKHKWLSGLRNFRAFNQLRQICDLTVCYKKLNLCLIANSAQCKLTGKSFEITYVSYTNRCTTLTEMKNLVIILLSLFVFGCTNYDCEDLEYKDGFQYEKTTGNLANGHYKCIDIRTSGGSSKHVTEYQYKDGLGVGKWTYHAQGQLIHNGEYLDCPDLKDLIKSKTEAKIIEIEAWYEGEFGQLNIDIVSPRTNLDSINSLFIMKNHTSEICSKYKLQQVEFRQRINGKWSNRSFHVN